VSKTIANINEALKDKPIEKGKQMLNYTKKNRPQNMAKF